MLELTQGLGLDLADAFAGDAELLADFFKGMVGIHANAKAHTQHPLFARGQAGQDPGRGFAQVGLDGGINGQDGILVLDEVAQMAVFFIADWGLEADRFLGDFQDLADLFQRHG